MTKTKPMTDEWKEGLKEVERKFYDKFPCLVKPVGYVFEKDGTRREVEGAVESRDDVVYFYRKEITKLLTQATSKAREEELDKIIDAVKKSYETQRDFNGDIESRGIAYGWNNCLDFIQSLIQKDK